MSTKEKSTSIYDEMMNNRMIFITEAITVELLARVMPTLFYFDAISNEPIHIYISSAGGDVMAGLGIIDLMNEIKSPVHTYAIGLVASMASMIFLFGQERTMLPNAQIMIHQPLGQAMGQASDIEITTKRILATKHKLTRMVVERTGMAESKVVEMMDRDTWLDYNMAKESGFLKDSAEKNLQHKAA